MNPATNIFDLDQESMREFFVGMDEKPFRATQLMKWVYHQGRLDFTEMTDLPKSMRTWLIDNARKSCETEFDDGEDIAILTVPLRQIPELLRSGKITHSLVVAAFHWLDLQTPS